MQQIDLRFGGAIEETKVAREGLRIVILKVSQDLLHSHLLRHSGRLEVVRDDGEELVFRRIDSAQLTVAPTDESAVAVDEVEYHEAGHDADDQEPELQVALFQLLVLDGDAMLLFGRLILHPEGLHLRLGVHPIERIAQRLVALQIFQRESWVRGAIKRIELLASLHLHFREVHLAGHLVCLTVIGCRLSDESLFLLDLPQVTEAIDHAHGVLEAPDAVERLREILLGLRPVAGGHGGQTHRRLGGGDAHRVAELFADGERLAEDLHGLLRAIHLAVGAAKVTEQFGAHGQGLRRRDLAERLEPLTVHDDGERVVAHVVIERAHVVVGRGQTFRIALLLGHLEAGTDALPGVVKVARADVGLRLHGQEGKPAGSVLQGACGRDSQLRAVDALTEERLVVIVLCEATIEDPSKAVLRRVAGEMIRVRQRLFAGQDGCQAIGGLGAFSSGAGRLKLTGEELHIRVALRHGQEWCQG